MYSKHLLCLVIHFWQFIIIVENWNCKLKKEMKNAKSFLYGLWSTFFVRNQRWHEFVESLNTRRTIWIMVIIFMLDIWLLLHAGSCFQKFCLNWYLFDESTKPTNFLNRFFVTWICGYLALNLAFCNSSLW